MVPPSFCPLVTLSAFSLSCVIFIFIPIIDREAGRGAREEEDFPVPDIVHFYFKNGTDVTAVGRLCLRAALSFHPRVYLHTEDPEGLLGGLAAWGHWPPGLRVLPFAPRGPAFEGEGASLRAARYAGLRILRTHGGIFLGNDVFLVQSLERYRRYKMTVSLSRGGLVQTQLLMAAKDARFLRLWLDSYLYYRPERELMASLPVSTVHTLPEAVLPVFGDVFFVPDGLDAKGVLALQLVS